MPPKTILVADDEKAHRLMLRAHLEREGFDVVEASDGQDAITKVGEHIADLVLMDIRMPVIDGMEALTKI